MNRLISFSPFLSILFILFFHTSCDESEKPIRFSGYAQYAITIDEQLLDAESQLRAFGTIMRLPRYWNDVMTVNEMPQHYLSFGKLRNPYTSLQDRIFGDNIKDAYILISEIPDAEAYKKVLLKDYENFLNPDGDLANLNKSSYQLNNLLVHHYLLQTPQTVNIKLFIERGAEKPFQIDFIMPAYVYQEDVRAIQSAIGTLQKP